MLSNLNNFLMRVNAVLTCSYGDGWYLGSAGKMFSPHQVLKNSR